ncbi:MULTISPECIES: MoaD/ThiS family protein [Desulfobacula]|uniref:Molybdopterin synthase sulfur carrier subunit n=2 Tax=Desulfobacula TaxID=28222 RepID=A0A1H2E0I8_9BACT|nr:MULTISPECIES: MoaD/ThiS family protein [Desulfobacula]CCK78648.1 putative ThiS family protein [Desulfobacula toluolica Tol2]SDT88623.1 molybdopterin synthase sulfur carrier subunit [Desulfobacula phenolica]
MEITIRLTKSLARLNHDQKDTVRSLSDGCDLAKLIELLDQDMSGIKKTLINHNGDINDSINIYVNGENVRYLQGTGTTLSDGDHIGIIPAAAAG